MCVREKEPYRVEAREARENHLPQHQCWGAVMNIRFWLRHYSRNVRHIPVLHSVHWPKLKFALARERERERAREREREDSRVQEWSFAYRRCEGTQTPQLLEERLAAKKSMASRAAVKRPQ